MSKEELKRKTLLEAYRCGKLSLKDCAERLSVSYRQMKRIWRRYRDELDQGLCHQNRGRKPINAYSDEFRESVLRLYQEKYLAFGPTFAVEKMEEDDNLLIKAETLRLWLKRAGLWTKKRKRVVHREKRERRSHFGDLLQIDGSIHGWFSDDRRDCLLNMVDDATGKCFALLDSGETTWILLTCLKKWIEKYGIPNAVYVDLKSVYVGSKPLKEKYDDDLLIKEGFSYFEQACKKLGIEIIRAYTPQAKGRVERKHGVFQDRLVKDLKLYGIKTITEANRYLEEKFLDKINLKFSQPPKSAIDHHRDPAPYGDLDEILCWSYRRQLRNDWSIRFNNEYFQVKKVEGDIIQPGEFITIRKYLDGNMRFWCEEIQVNYNSLSRKPVPPSKIKKKTERKERDPVERSLTAKKNKHKTPWGRSNSNWLSNKRTAINAEAVT